MKPLEHDDPMELVGVGYPLEVSEESDLHTGRCLVEEFALAGFSAREVGRLFSSPAYGLSHAIFQRRGDEFVRNLIVGVFGEAR